MTPKYFMMPHGPGGNFASLVHYDVERRATFQHLVRNKASLDGFPHPNALLMRPMAEQHLEALRQVWHGRLWYNAGPTGIEHELIRQLVSTTWAYERRGTGSDRKGEDRRLMTFLYERRDGRHPVYRIGEGMARCEASWSVFHQDDQGLLVVHSVEGLPTFFARQTAPDLWEGAWCVHEEPRITLRRQEITPSAGLVTG